MRRVAIVLVLSLATQAGPASAHEFWMQPDDFDPAPGAETPVRFFVGERFRAEEFPWDPTRAAELLLVSPRRSQTLRGEPGATPATWVRAEEPGPRWLALRSNPAVLELAADRFNAYLLDDGLYTALAARRAAGDFESPGRERFTRYAKTLFASALDAEAAMASRLIGHRLEIVPETSTASLVDGAREIVVRVLFEAEPLTGAVIFAAPASSPEDGLQRGLTDAEGRSRFTLDVEGPWMISLVHMIECHDCADADWDSSWATLVFAHGDDLAGSLSSAP